MLSRIGSSNYQQKKPQISSSYGLSVSLNSAKTVIQ